MSQTATLDQFGNVWQYHSRGDKHSRLACWGITLDLLLTCALLRNHVERGVVGFGINHLMADFKTAREKKLDLVLCTPGTLVKSKRAKPSFADMGAGLGAVLTSEEASALANLPRLEQVPVGSVHLALEAKACMTAHIKALPRLYDELNSSHLAIHGASDYSIAAAFVMINFSEAFRSSDMNKFDMSKIEPRVTKHRIPTDVNRALDKVKEIPRRTTPGTEGFDALGIVLVECKNDGSPIRIVSEPPAPKVNDLFHYDSLIRRIAHHYESKFGNI